jgi:hypothetical protein
MYNLALRLWMIDWLVVVLSKDSADIYTSVETQGQCGYFRGVSDVPPFLARQS